MMITVLYIDDTPGLLREAKQFLERTGSFTVNTTISEIDVLDLLAHTRYDIIVSAIEMTGMSGIDILSQIRECYASIPFIFITNILPYHLNKEGIFLEADYIIERRGSPIQVYEDLSLKILRAVKRRRRELVLRERSLEKENKKNPFQEGTWVINPEGTTIYGGMEIASILGFTREEFWKRTIFSLMTDPEKNRIVLSFEKVRKNGVKNLVLELIGNDHMKRIIRSEEARLCVDDRGGDLFAFSGITEVTHLNHTKMIKEQYMELCDSLLNNLNGVLWILNTVTMTLQYVSPSASHFYGYTAENLMGRHIDRGDILKIDRSLSDIIWERVVCHLSTDTPPLFYSDSITQNRSDGFSILTEIKSEYYLNKENDQIMVRGFTKEKIIQNEEENGHILPDSRDCLRQEMRSCLTTMRECAVSPSQITEDESSHEFLEKIDLLEFALTHWGMWLHDTRDIIERFISIQLEREDMDN